MTKTDLIKEMIANTGMSIKAFAENAGIPYTTLRSMLERGIENASVNNVIKICSKLNISVETLYEITDKNISLNNNLNAKEKILLNNYNSLNDLGKKKMIDYSDDLINNYKYIEPYTFAAHDDDLTEEESIRIKSQAKKIFEEMDKE